MLLVALFVAGMCIGCTAVNSVLTGTAMQIDETGNVHIDGILPEDVANAGIKADDVVRLSVNDKTWDMVFAGSIGDSASKMFEPALAFEDDAAVALIKHRNCAEVLGVSAGGNTTVKIALLEEEGHQVLYDEFSDARSNDRSRFVSDAQFANFREITFGGIAPHTLYRSSTPVSPELCRASYADDLIENACIRMVVNLKDTNEDVQVFMTEAGFDSPFYKSLYDGGHVIALDNETVQVRSSCA